MYVTVREVNFYVLYSIRKEKRHVLYNSIGQIWANLCMTFREGNFCVVYSIKKYKSHVS
jgi:hypothetical protein